MGLFDDPPGSRNNDPDTSRNAKQFNLTEDRIDVLGMHVSHPAGLTDFELAGIMGRQQTSVGKRRGELRDYGYVIDSGLRRPAPSGSSSIVWRILPAGEALYRHIIFTGRRLS